MTTQEVATKLVEFCKLGQYKTAQEELYADDATSTELDFQSGEWKVITGKAAIIEKGLHFQSMIEEVFGGSVGEPIVAGKFFSITQVMDVKLKGMDRMLMEEIAVYKVVDGKVVSEQFFY